MKVAALFGLLALTPASLNAGAPASLAIRASSCTGAPRSITIPLRPGAPSPEDGKACCAKGCHAGGSRKRSARGC